MHFFRKVKIYLKRLLFQTDESILNDLQFLHRVNGFVLSPFITTGLSAEDFCNAPEVCINILSSSIGRDGKIEGANFFHRWDDD